MEEKEEGGGGGEKGRVGKEKSGALYQIIS